MIPEPFIQELLHRIDLVELIDGFVPLKKAGANFAACCPFHSEKSPSFTVSPTKQFYHCFGCGAHGTAISFLMEYSGLGFIDAIKDLAGRAGMQLPEQEGRQQTNSPKLSSLTEIMADAARYYYEQLKRSEKAIGYLKERGVSGEVAQKFGIGYAPDGWQNLGTVFQDYTSEGLQQAGMVIKNEGAGLPVQLGEVTSFPVIMTVLGLAAIFGLERRKVPGGILMVIIAISILGLIFDPKVTWQGFFAMPSLTGEKGSLVGSMDLLGALNPVVIPTVLALVMTAVFDATGTIRAVAGQAGLINERGHIISGGKALTADSVSSMVAGVVGGAPAAVYIESAAGTAAGGKTGLTAALVGVLFLLMIFLSPLSYLVPAYATAPALMYVGLLMLGNVTKLDFSDSVDALAGMLCAVFIVLTCNIVTGIMLGFVALVVGRIFAAEWKKLNIGTVIIALALVIFYAGGWAI